MQWRYEKSVPVPSVRTMRKHGVPSTVIMTS
jgi:hypothetical protein